MNSHVDFVTPSPLPDFEPSVHPDECPNECHVEEDVLRALELVIDAQSRLHASPLAHNLQTARAALEAFAEAWRD